MTRNPVPAVWVPNPRSTRRFCAASVERLAAALLAVTALMVSAFPADAEPIRRLGQNPRGLALGGTGMSYADDEMALYYNPAGLGSVNKIWVELLPIALEGSPDGVEFIQDKAQSQNTDLASLSGVATLIEESIDKDLHYRAFAYPTAIVGLGKGLTWGVGGFWEAEVDLEFHNQATPELDAYYRNDQGTAAGLAFPLADGKVLFGVGGRRIRREVGQGTLGSAELAIAAANDELDLSEQLNLRKGTGVAYDAGLIYRLEALSLLRSQFAFAVQNIGDTDLEEAGVIQQEMSVGFAARPKFAPLVQTLFAIEFRDAEFQATDDKSNEKRLHVGLEVGFLPFDVSTNLVTGRIGWGSGGPSYGVEFAFSHFISIQYVFYSQEYGDVAGDDLRERHILQFNLIGF